MIEALVSEGGNDGTSHIQQPKKVGFKSIANLPIAHFLDRTHQSITGTVRQHINSIECL
jgi:hypothetical protein